MFVSLATRPLAVNADRHSQGTSCKRGFKHGSLLQILPSIRIMRAKFIMMEPQIGLFEAAHTENGRRMVLYCGLMATVRFSRLFCLDGSQFLSIFPSRCWKEHSFVCDFRLCLLQDIHTVGQLCHYRGHQEHARR